MTSTKTVQEFRRNLNKIKDVKEICRRCQNSFFFTGKTDTFISITVDIPDTEFTGLCISDAFCSPHADKGMGHFLHSSGIEGIDSLFMMGLSLTVSSISLSEYFRW